MPNASSTTRNRVAQLDSARGIAALSVLIFHCLLVVKGSYAPVLSQFEVVGSWLAWTPLRLLWVGHGAVVLFFVLSGFVLYLMLARGHLSFRHFALRRFLRLYLPYAAVVIFGVIGAAVLYDGRLPGLNDWINKFWSWPITFSSLWHTFLAVDAFNSDRYVFTIWSLVHELRISLIFVLLFVFIRRVRWWQALLPFLLLSAAVMGIRFGISIGALDLGRWVYKGGLSAYTLTAHYTLAFVIGALLARNREAIGHWYARLPGYCRVILGMTALALYLYTEPVVSQFQASIMTFEDWPLMAGAALGMIIMLNEPFVIRCLERRLLLHLGAVSYSLYLFHPLVLLAALHLLYPQLPLWVVLVVAIPGSLLIADLAYRFIERPATRLSRRVGSKEPSRIPAYR